MALGGSRGRCSAVTTHGKRYIVQSDDILAAFSELEATLPRAGNYLDK